MLAPGFFQIVGHSISPDLRGRLLKALELFFALSAETKQSVHRRHSPCLRGYEGLSEQELEKGVRDQKEGFMIGLMFRLMALSLGLEERYFDAFADSKDSVTMCRSHRYPPTPPDAAEMNKGIGPHTDSGALTLLLQDEKRWTNDKYTSTLHRVMSPVSAQYRYSVAFFNKGLLDQVISCIPTCLEPDEKPRYSPVVVEEHLKDCYTRSF
ncbi:oxidoreductase [Ophiostoma piceae UAMH 11346]|uniref:Oxidoreductase n=1 Tax=Ophiostoma piceae (strain UAMH 11346) TaxID=1262450 RepID=S3BRF8_OPHP1|nr:oxidoreductase [Ophiostoma piceae UAMH 11346]